MASEFLCFHCGARNYVREGWGGSRIKCMNCGNALISLEKGTSPGSVVSFLFKLLVVLVVIGVSYLSFAGWRNGETALSLLERFRVFSSNVGQYIESALPKRPQEQKESLPKELPLPKMSPPKESSLTESHARKEPLPTKNLPPAVKQRPGVVWNKTLLLPQAPFEIQTSYGTDYYIKLVDAETNRDAMAIYVIGGHDLEVLVPLGSYKMRYAYGETWRGEQHLFGPGDLTTVEEALESFEFTMSFEGFSGYIVELIPQIDGNLPTQIITRDEF